MKKIYLLLAILLTVSVSLSCEKDEKSIVDCFTQSLLFDVHHAVSDENPLHVDLSVSYYGSESYDNFAIWDFGDGTPVQVLPGKTATHTYTSNENYIVKAKVTLNNGSCATDLKEKVNLD